jgi:peptidoglycan/LPS O-acetylase OafA/YrhL
LPLKSLGDASYSIYLCHTLAMGTAALHFGIWNTPLFAPLGFVFGVAVGWLVWRLAEVPVLALLRPRPAPPAARLA